MSAETEILSSRLDRLESERLTWNRTGGRLLMAEGHITKLEEHLTAHCAEIDDILTRLDEDDAEFDDVDRQLDKMREIQVPTPLCPFCGEEMHWARYANDKSYLRCPECGKTCLPPAPQPGD